MNLEDLIKQAQTEHKVDPNANAPRGDLKDVTLKFLRILQRISIEENNRDFVVNDINRSTIEFFCRYLNNQEDNRKGIFIVGNFGSGKTMLMKAYAEFNNRHIRKESVVVHITTDLNILYLKIDKWSEKPQKMGLDAIKYIYSDSDSCERVFDDLGAEETTVQDYGNKFSVMAHVISERHRNRLKTHFTTNLSMGKLDSAYGGRIESRMNEMCHILVLGSSLDSQDFRKV